MNSINYKYKKFIHIFFIFIGLLLLLDFIVLSIYSGGMDVGILIPGFVGFFLISYSAIKLSNIGFIIQIKNTFIKRLLVIAVAIALLSVVFVETLIITGHKEDSNPDVDFLIVLGAGLKGDQLTLTLSKRMYKALEYLNSNPNTLAVVSGGQGFGETIPEGEAMKRFLVSNGISEDRIIKEDKSTSTMENFKFTKEIIKNTPLKNKNRILIVTNDFHMFRAKFLAKRNGFEAYGLPSKTPVSVILNVYIREYFAVVKSYFLDRT